MSTNLYSNLTVSKPLVLGASRGLGLEVLRRFPDAVGCSRKSENSIDFSKEGAVSAILELIKVHNPDAIFYVAGGGPHGDFFSKPFHSHKWAYQVNYFTPVALAYELIAQNYEGVFVYIGSAIAERSESNQSLSYSQSKKMTKQSLLSLHEKDLKIRIFSPPYMNTGMLTKNAWPRTEAPDLVIEPVKAAEKLTDWLGDLSLSKGDSDVRHFDWLEEFTYDIPSNREF